MVQVLSSRGIHFDFPVSVVGDQSVPGQGLSGQAAHLSSAPASPGFLGTLVVRVKPQLLG